MCACENICLKVLYIIVLGLLFVDMEILRKTVVEFLQLRQYLDTDTY
jgi:hypothetical protein